MSTIPLIQRSEHERFINAGYSSTVKEEIFYNTKIYDVMQYSKTLSTQERVKQFVVGSLVSLLSVCLVPCCNEAFYIETFVEPIEGESHRKKIKYNHEKTEKYYDELSAKIGFNPFKQETIINYLNKGNNLSGFQSHLGHRFKPHFIHQANFSGFFFIPSNDLNRATMIRMNYNGKPLSTLELLNSGYSWCESYRPGVTFNTLPLDSKRPIIIHLGSED
ncbi:MAG: hypothetical protein K1060chlam4_00576 [Candidatus Anoxychlamydiales bacterium]|nr:hypothetical protein [Candidatus Anoxychlamydiales bacterium]